MIGTYWLYSMLALAPLLIMSDSSHSLTNTSIPASTFNPGHQLPAQPFQIQQQAQTERQSASKSKLDRLRQLDAGVMQALGVQAKLAIGAPGDKYEQEADQVAAQVVEQINAPRTQQKSVQRQELSEDDEDLQMKPLATSIQRQELPEEEDDLQMKPLATSIQRQELPEEKEDLQMKPLTTSIQRQELPEKEDELQAKPLVNSIQRQELPEEDEDLQMKPLANSIQRQELPEEKEDLQMKPLTTSIQRQELPEKEDELQAKPLVNSIQRQELPEEDEDLQMKPLANSIQRQELPEEKEDLQMKPLVTSIQRQELPEKEELQTKPLMQRRSDGGGVASTDVESAVESARGQGQSLGAEVRNSMEQAFGTDFSSVKVHTDSQSDQLNNSIQARAFTTGQDIFFRQGEYRPESSQGQELLAHELTHVLQQTDGVAQARTVQRRSPDPHVGAVQEGYSLQNTEGGIGDKPGDWHDPGEGGYSRLLQGAAGEMVEGMAEKGALGDTMLKHVAPDLSGIPAQQKEWAARAAENKAEIDSWGFGFSTGFVRDLYKGRYESSTTQVATIEECGAELEQKANQFNSFVPQGNAFYISASRLSSMQALLGATDNTSMAEALVEGLNDAEDVMTLYKDKYDDGERRGTTEKLDVPEKDESVEAAANNMTDASRNLDAKYMGFQTTVLSGKLGDIKAEYKDDETKLAEINKVKQFVRNVGKTIDVSMSFVRGAPTKVANVTESVRKGKAGLNAARNKRDMLAGKRPSYNPTYVTSDKDGNLVVRNMQTGIDRNMMTDEKTPMPESGIELPSNVSDLMGKLADFAYASDVRKINFRLEQMKIRLNGVKAVIDTTLVKQRIVEYQNALNEFATKAAALQDRIADRRREYMEFGKQLDRFAQVDRDARKAALGVARGAERYTTIMTMVSGIQEMLALGGKSQVAAPSGLPEWWQTVKDRRFGAPTEGEFRTVNNIYKQLVTFRGHVNLAKDMFGEVASKATALVGKY